MTDKRWHLGGKSMAASRQRAADNFRRWLLVAFSDGGPSVAHRRQNASNSHRRFTGGVLSG